MAGWALGLLGLLISLRAELFDACGDPLAQASVNAVKMYSKQLENQQMDNVHTVTSFTVQLTQFCRHFDAWRLDVLLKRILRNFSLSFYRDALQDPECTAMPHGLNVRPVSQTIRSPQPVNQLTGHLVRNASHTLR